MTIKQAILNEKEYNNITPRILPSVEFRAPVRNYKEFYTEDQIAYLWDHRMIEEYQKCGATWERPYEEYWQFTDKGRRWRVWYTTPLWLIIKIYVLRVYWFKYKWQKLRIKFGHHYDWQDYEGLDISEI